MTLTTDTADPRPAYGFYVAGASEPVPDNCEIIPTPYEFFKGLGKVIRKNAPHKQGQTADIQLPKNNNEVRRLCARLAVDALLRDAIIKALGKQNRRLVEQLEALGQEVEEYQNEILELDKQIEALL